MWCVPTHLNAPGLPVARGVPTIHGHGYAGICRVGRGLVRASGTDLVFSRPVFPWKWGSDPAQEQGRRSSTFSPTVIYLQSASICCPCAPRSKGAEGCSGWTDGTGVSTGSTEPSFTQENMPAPLFVICGSCKLQLEVTGGVLDMGGVEECLFIGRVG